MTPDHDGCPKSVAHHWDAAYAEGEMTRSWFEEEPTMSLRLLDSAGVVPAMTVVDVGGGTSRLADALLARGHTEVTVLDVSHVALDVARARLGSDAERVEWSEGEVGTWSPARRYGVWHDRAVLHFMVTEHDQARYLRVLRAATGPGSVAVFGCFAQDGPSSCSGLPVVRRDPGDLEDLLGGEWSLVARDRELHPTPHGGAQAFTWAAFRRRDAL